MYFCFVTTIQIFDSRRFNELYRQGFIQTFFKKTDTLIYQHTGRSCWITTIEESGFVSLLAFDAECMLLVSYTLRLPYSRERD
jgi:hypothetical protein